MLPLKLRLQRAFTLLEMLVVIGLVVVLAGILVPALTPVAEGHRLTNSVENIAAELNYARQIALSLSRNVEVRFYELPGANNQSHYSAFSTVETSTNRVLTKVEKLPQGVIMAADDKFSTLLGSGNTEHGTENLASANNQPVPYKVVRFTANGGTTLDPRGASGGNDEWFITVRLLNAKPEGDRPAANFGTLHVDPVTGRVRVYRP